jgi:hypothetical protein
MPSTVYSKIRAACGGAAREQHYFEAMAFEASRLSTGLF